MRVAVSADELSGIAGVLIGELERRGHVPLAHGALRPGDREDWAWASESVAQAVRSGHADQGIVCCWTGTGASIAANKTAGVRAALCTDGPTASGARRWNDANVLALSLRSTSEAQLGEILDAWFSTEVSVQASDRANIEHLRELEHSTSRGVLAQLSVRHGRAAIEFYKRAFGAEEVYRVGGTDAHEAVVAQLCVGTSGFWVADESPEHANFSPETIGGGTVRMLLIVEDPDCVLAAAVANGAREIRGVTEEHHWRLGRIEDPFGHHWEIGRPLIPWPPRPEPTES